MSLQQAERKLGPKKMAIMCTSVIENIRDHELSRCLSIGDWDQCYTFLYNYCMSGGSLNIRDGHTKESFLHILADYTHLYLSASATRIFYILCVKIDMDYVDVNGDTALHKVVRVPGSWRAIVALMRCGANPLIKNKAGRTPEEEILHLKTVGYEENLHWLRKFLPGLWAAVLSRQPDPVLVERLLRYWCRTAKMEGTEPRNLKCVMHMLNAPLDFVCIVEQYENTNEMALSMLSGKAFMVDHWKKTKESVSSVDVNTKDHSYQFHYREYPTAPRPLVAAVWEMDDFDLMKAFMNLNPDLLVKYTFESEASSQPKPLFFQLVNPKSRPHNEAITAHILTSVNLNTRTVEGRTILMEAMYNGETEGIIRTILNAGVNLAARDGLGKTARDHADILKRSDYRNLIDSRVTELIHAGDASTIETFVLQQYPYVCQNISKLQIMNMLRQQRMRKMVEILKNNSCTQNTVQKLFALAQSGNKVQFTKLLTRNFGPCRDKAGRSLLHFAIQHSCSSLTANLEDEVLYRNSQNQSESRLSPSSSSSEIGTEETYLLSDRLILADNSSGSQGQINERDKKVYKIGKCQGRLCKLMKRHGWKPQIFCPCDFQPDPVGIVRHLVNEFPYMLDLQNAFGQTPLHYAYIYTAPQEIFHILEKAGSRKDVKDVFDFEPKDYSKELCGNQTFNVRRKMTVELDLEIFLEETNFKESFHKAVVNGNIETVKKLVLPLLDLGGSHKFSGILFDCLDMGRFDIVAYLLDVGFPHDVTKQYESCNPDNPMCAMMECSHAVTTLRQRAEDTGAVEVASLIDKLQNNESQEIINIG
ncbi:ankyrin-1-like [Plakobranchus ocellatus]|uniref:Ankyrin-1-like n=1 Tax=Plakobranchus ocellatus TaxID=259542 RepID=A0AAV3Z1Z9_9GAST|nr:ankyrin-1-like [Plakobranchus ocellatus]